LCREEIREAKAQVELRLATVVRDNKNCFYKYISNKKRAKENLPYWMQGGSLPPRIRLKYLMPSLPQSLTVRLVFPRVFSPWCWKTGIESRINLP